jgi:uncharacterized repeat protein (TIGR03987 family)
MSSLVVFSSTTITLALVFYSIGIWAERISLYLKGWHVIAFWLGFAFDVTGTVGMQKISDDPFDITDLHTMTGQLALWLMLAHAIWASWVVIKGTDRQRRSFHRYSIFVWLIWLIPYLGGMYIGMTGH